MSDEQRLSTLLSSAGLVMLGGLVGSGSKLAERVVIGRFLSPEAYGDVSVGIAVLSFSTTFALAGFSQGVPRYISRFDDEEDRRGAWATGLAIAGTLAVLFAAVLFLAMDEIIGLLFEQPDSTTMVVLFAAAIPFVVGLQIAIGGIRGHENTIYRTYTKDLLYPLGRIALIALLLAGGVSIVAAGWAYLIAAVVTCLFAHYLLNRLLPLVGPVRFHTREMVRFSLPLVLSTVMGVLLTRTDTLMVAAIRDSYEVGLYSAAYPIAGGLLVVLSAFGFIYLPMASRLDADDDRESINTIYRTTTKWVYVVTFPAFVVFAVFPADVMRLFFGAEYVPAAPALPILAAGFFLSAAAGRNRETLSALGDTDLIMLANGGGLALNVALNLVLIPRLGFVGAAVTSALSFALVHGSVCGFLWRRYEISPFTLESLRTFLLLPVLVLPPTVFVAGSITITAMSLLPVLCFLGLVSLLVVAAGGGLQPEDIVVLEVIEDQLGSEIPGVRRYIPEE